MADSKKYNGSTWEHSLRKLTTATDTFTTLPADIYADGNNATVGLKGNTVQSGTPTPDNPIMPQGCGDLETVGAKAGQYKIPILNGQQTTNIYLGSTQTIRQVKKLVLTGDEYWVYQANNLRFVMTINNIVVSGLRATPFFCTHYIPISDGRPIEDVPLNASYLATVESNAATLNIKIDTYTTAADFKAYLAAQYAAGTPVTVWFAIPTPETAIVNEPLMKIGNYADTVSGITIPTITSKDTFDVDTTLKPSEVSLSYTGWHDAYLKEKSENYLDENDFGLVEVAAGTYRVGIDVGVLPSGKYTFNAVKSSSAVQIYRTTKNGSTYNYEAISELPYTFTADGVSNQIFRSAGNTGSSWADLGYSDIMLNTGETAQSYEPYWK